MNGKWVFGDILYFMCNMLRGSYGGNNDNEDDNNIIYDILVKVKEIR